MKLAVSLILVLATAMVSAQSTTPVHAAQPAARVIIDPIALADTPADAHVNLHDRTQLFPAASLPIGQTVAGPGCGDRCGACFICNFDTNRCVAVPNCKPPLQQ